MAVGSWWTLGTEHNACDLDHLLAQNHWNGYAVWHRGECARRVQVPWPKATLLSGQQGPVLRSQDPERPR